MGFTTRTIHEVDEKSSPSLYKLLRDFLKAYTDRTRAWSESPSGETSVNQKLDAIIEMLHPVADVGFIKEELSTVHGLQSDVLTAINNLDRKVDGFMATQEERLQAVKGKLDAIQSGVDKIQQQLADLKTNNPELDDEISAIEATANAIDTDVNPVVEPPPPVEPSPEG